MSIDVITPDNKTWSIQDQNLGAALKRGARLPNAGERIKVSTPDGKRWDIKTSNLQNALERGASLAEPELGDYGQAFYQGAAKGLGKLADTAVAGASALGGAVGKYAGNPNPALSNYDNDEFSNQPSNQMFDTARDYWQNPKIEKAASDTFDNGLDHFKGIRVAQSAGEATGTLPAFSLAAKGVQLATKAGGIANVPWIQKLNKFLQVDVNAKTAASFAGMGAGSELAKSDDPNVGTAENVARELVGGIIGGVVPHYNMKALKTVYDFTKSLPQKIKDAPSGLGANFLGLFGKEVDVKGYEALKNLGSEPTADMILKNNRVASWIGKARNDLADDVIANTSELALKDVEKSLEKHLGEFIGKNEPDLKAASTNASEHFIKEVDKHLEQLQQQSTGNYEQAFSLLRDTPPVPTNALAEVKQQLRKVKAPTTSGTSDTGQGMVTTALQNIEKDWSVNGAAIQVDPMEMLAQMKAISEMQRVGKTKNYTKLLSPVSDAIEKDLLAVGNKEFVQEYNAAKSFYKDQIVPYVKTDIGKSLLIGETPKTAYSMTNNVDGMNELEGMLLRHPKGKELMNMLKRTRAQEYLVEKVFANGELQPRKFLDLFNNSKNDEYLYALLGDSYKPIKDNISDVASALERTKKAMGNPSGTAKNLTTGAGLYEVGKGAVTGNAMKVAEGVAILTLPKMLANAMLAPKVAERLVKAAKAKNDRGFAQIITNSIKEVGNTIAESPATKYQTLNYGANGVLPAFMLPDMDFRSSKKTSSNEDEKK